MTAAETEKNYAPLWKKVTVIGAVCATAAGLMVAQNLTQVKASENSEYIAVEKFAAGTNSATILSTDGKAYSRGWNNMGQLGVATGSKVNVSDWTEINVPEKIVSVESTDHTVALGESGTLYSWGNNANGQIGNNNTVPVFTPTEVTATDRYDKVASGERFTLAIDSQGRLWSWGANNAGQLGDGTTTDRSTPKMIDDKTVFTEIYASKATSYAIDKDGKLWAWGDNTEGQFGNGKKESLKAPVQVDANKTWTQLAVSMENSTVLGIDSNGWLYSWGSNSNGLLGNGTDWRALQEEENRRFEAMIERIKQQDATRKANLINQCVETAYLEAKAVYDVEYERLTKEKEAAEEQIRKREEERRASEEPTEEPSEAEPTETVDEEGNPIPTPSETPVPTPTPTPTEPALPEIIVPDPEALEQPVRENFAADCNTQVSATFVETDTSDMKPEVIEEPELKKAHAKPELVTSSYRVKDIAVGSENAYIVDSLSRLQSWGKDANGQTGLGLEDAESHTQVPVVIEEGVYDVDAGSKYGVAVNNFGNLLLWGANTNGVLMSDPSSEPKLLEPTNKGDGYSSVIAGSTTVYGTKGSTTHVWGNNVNGEAGVGSADKAIYTSIPLERTVESLAPSSKGAAALGEGGELLNWGVNDAGQFGNSAISADIVPKIQTSKISVFTDITAGKGLTTAVSADGRVWGWGTNNGNLLSLNGKKANQLTPIAVVTGMDKVTAVASGKNVSAFTNGTSLTIWAKGGAHTYELADINQLVAGDSHVVALTSDGRVWSWSLDGSGAREGSKPRTLTQVDENAYTSVSAGGSVSGAVTTNGEAIIWGKGSENLRLAEKEGDPVQNFKFKNISISDGYVIATDENDVLWGWGQNSYLVLGAQSAYKFPTVLTEEKDAKNAVEEGK